MGDYRTEAAQDAETAGAITAALLAYYTSSQVDALLGDYRTASAQDTQTQAAIAGADQDVFTNQITSALVAYRSAADQDTATASSIAAALLSYYTIAQVDGLLAGKLGVTEAAESGARRAWTSRCRWAESRSCTSEPSAGLSPGWRSSRRARWTCTACRAFEGESVSVTANGLGHAGRAHRAGQRGLRPAAVQRRELHGRVHGHRHRRRGRAVVHRGRVRQLAEHQRRGLSSATGITGSTLTINNTANAGNFTTVGDVSTGTLTASGAATAASFAATGRHADHHRCGLRGPAGLREPGLHLHGHERRSVDGQRGVRPRARSPRRSSSPPTRSP